MEIVSTKNNNSLTLALQGRLDTTTAPQLEKTIKTALDGVTELIFDFVDLKYISSAGLRVILASQKIMNKQGIMKIRNVNSEIMEVFEITGFSDILTFE